jgi:hypothetical protein
MDKIPRPLLWKIIKLDPALLFLLEAMSLRLNRRLQSDIDAFYYFHEKTFENLEVRISAASYAEAKSWLFDELNSQRFLANFLINTLKL